MKFQKIKLYLAIAFLLNLILSRSYVTYFADSLENEEWMVSEQFESIVIPDTYVFRQVAVRVAETDIDIPLRDGTVGTKKVSLIESILWWGTRIQNTYIPSLIWFASNYNWHFTTLFNSILALITSVYICLICAKLNIKRFNVYYISVLNILLPVNLYHSIGSLKEMPTSMLMTVFIYYFLNKQHKIALLFAILLVLTRYQLIVVIAIFYLISTHKKPLKLSIFILIGASAILPYLRLDILESAAGNIFRQRNFSTLGIGAFVEYIRNEIPFASTFAVIIRVMQTIYEPIIGFVTGSTDHYFKNGINVIVGVYLISNILLLKMWIKSTFIILTKIECRREISLILSFFLIYIILVGGFSFISHRYISGIIPIMMIIASKYCFNFNFINIMIDTNIIMNRSFNANK